MMSGTHPMDITNGEPPPKNPVDRPTNLPGEIQPDTDHHHPTIVRQKIICCFSDVIKHLGDIDAITDVMISKMVFTFEDAKRVTTEITEEKKARELIHILTKKPDRGISVFMNALMECNSHIHQMIMASEVNPTTPPVSETISEIQTLHVYLEACITQYLVADQRGHLELGVVTKYIQQQCTSSGLPHTVSEEDVTTMLTRTFNISINRTEFYGQPSHITGLSWKPEIRDKIIKRQMRLHSAGHYSVELPSILPYEGGLDVGYPRRRTSSMDRSHLMVLSRERSRTMERSKPSPRSQSFTPPKELLRNALRVPTPPPLPPDQVVRNHNVKYGITERSEESESVALDTIQLLAEQLHHLINPMKSEPAGAQAFLSRMPLSDRKRVVSHLVKDRTALYKAFYIHSYNLMVYMIEECHADVNQMFIPNHHTEWTTVLVQAACANRTKVAELVINHGADVNKADKAGALSLLEKLTINKPVSTHCAMDSNRVGMTAVMHACCRGHIHMLKFLVKSGAHIHLADQRNRTCLMMATSWPDILKYVLSLGSEVDDQDINGDTALHWAAQAHSVQCVRLLLQHRVEVNTRNNLGETALHMAVQNNSLGLVKVLLEHGEDMYVRNKHKEDALLIAIMNEQQDIIDVLLAHHKNTVLQRTP